VSRRFPGTTSSWRWEVSTFEKKSSCGLYYKHILTIVSDDRKWRLYYKCFICLCLSLG
jgi:hypothetical protein